MGAPIRVLVVEDNRDAANSLALLLGHFGCETRVAYEGAAASGDATAFEPDLMLIDLAMPRMNGLAVAKQLRQNPLFAKSLMIAVTGYGDAHHLQLSLEAGFDECVIKPVGAEKLLELLDRAKASRRVATGEINDTLVATASPTLLTL